VDTTRNNESLRNFSKIIIANSAQNCNIQGDHLSGKPENVREFDTCQGNVRDFTKNQGNVREKIL